MAFAQTDPHQWMRLREMVDQHFARTSQTRPASAPDQRGSSMRCPILDARASRLRQLQAHLDERKLEMGRYITAKARRPLSARLAIARTAVTADVGRPASASRVPCTPHTPRPMTPLAFDARVSTPWAFDARVGTPRATESRASYTNDAPQWSNTYASVPTDDHDAHALALTTPPSANASRPQTSAEKQDDECAAEAFEGVPVLRPDSAASIVDKEEAAPKKPVSPPKFRRSYGPKASLAHSAAARATAKWQMTLHPAKKIGQDMKSSHFNLTNISDDAISRGAAMDSSYRRTFSWNLRSNTEDSARLNPAPSLAFANLPTAL